MWSPARRSAERRLADAYDLHSQRTRELVDAEYLEADAAREVNLARNALNTVLTFEELVMGVDRA